MNINLGPATVNNNKVLLHALPFYNCDETSVLSTCDSSDYTNEYDDSKWNIFKKRLVYFIFECQ